MICSFPVECYKPAIGQKMKKNKQIMPAEQRANSQVK